MNTTSRLSARFERWRNTCNGSVKVDWEWAISSSHWFREVGQLFCTWSNWNRNRKSVRVPGSCRPRNSFPGPNKNALSVSYSCRNVVVAAKRVRLWSDFLENSFSIIRQSCTAPPTPHEYVSNSIDFRIVRSTWTHVGSAEHRRRRKDCGSLRTFLSIHQPLALHLTCSCKYIWALKYPSVTNVTGCVRTRWRHPRQPGNEIRNMSRGRNRSSNIYGRSTERFIICWIRHHHRVQTTLTIAPWCMHKRGVRVDAGKAYESAAASWRTTNWVTSWTSFLFPRRSSNSHNWINFFGQS